MKDYGQELLDVLPDLIASGFVLVRDDKRAIRGIVTVADVGGPGLATGPGRLRHAVG